MLVVVILLGFAAGLSAAGYVASAHGDRSQMPALLVAFILALGFLGVLLK